MGDEAAGWSIMVLAMGVAGSQIGAKAAKTGWKGKSRFRLNGNGPGRPKSPEAGIAGVKR